MLLRFAISASALVLVPLLQACAPGVNAPPATPTVGWQIRDETANTQLALTTVAPGQYQADVVGGHTFSVYFNANSPGGVGSVSTSGNLDAVQCGTITYIVGGKPPRAVRVLHNDGPKQTRAIDNFSYTDNANSVKTTGFEIYAFNASLSTPGYDLQLCPTNIGTLGGYIVLNGTATAWGDATKSASTTLTITLQPHVEGP
ncbi:hypothetical protein [Burkholderia sp. Ac-20365]|uniref:hypothetical protein n=1 Tax=Burkholderia sp. Ac-20365 TaxID=2703897 RepID=UPI00197BCFBB|nr:hypothetical protein [Burkholderia sp. Ac-20365]MBN3762005.1 hypothetical protein [Burkholderia sp. Ac-20365]